MACVGGSAFLRGPSKGCRLRFTCSHTYTLVHTHVYTHTHRGQLPLPQARLQAACPPLILELQPCLPGPHHVPLSRCRRNGGSGGGEAQAETEEGTLIHLLLEWLSHPGVLGQDPPCLSERATQSLSLCNEWDTEGLFQIWLPFAERSLLTGCPRAERSWGTVERGRRCAYAVCMNVGACACGGVPLSMLLGVSTHLWGDK